MLEKAKQLLKPSKRSDVPPFIVMDVMAAAAQREAQGAHIIHMEVGQPAAPAPATAIKAAQAALALGRIGYTETLGIPSLRGRIARHYQEAYGLSLDPGRVVVTTGSSGGFVLAFLSLFEPGDRVALANPGYPPYRHILSALGCEPVLIETSEQTRWALSPKIWTECIYCPKFDHCDEIAVLMNLTENQTVTAAQGSDAIPGLWQQLQVGRLMDR